MHDPTESLMPGPEAPLHEGADLPLLLRVKRAPPDWADEKIRAWDENQFRELEPFCRREYWCDNASVNVFHIIGTRHPDYAGLSWLELLHRGKSMRANLLRHSNNQDYYLGQERKKPSMSFVTLDGLDYFVDGDGNHRSAIARFDYHYRGRTMLHGVRISHYEIDTRLYRIYKDMQAWLESRQNIDPWCIAPHRTGVSREDEAGWKVDIHKPAIEVRNIRTDTTELLDADAAESRLERWRHDAEGPLRRLSGLFRAKFQRGGA